jgi:hypothetical protein
MRNMRKILHERNLVVVLFVMVIVTFSLAQRDSKKLEKIYNPGNPTPAVITLKPVTDTEKPPVPVVSLPLK